MHGVAGGAGNAIFVVGGTHEFALLRVALMTGHATPRNCLRPCTLENEDLGLIAASLNMGRARSVARLAAMDLFTSDLGQVGSVMRARIDVLELIFVATLASVGPNVGRAAGRIGNVLRGNRLRR